MVTIGGRQEQRQKYGRRSSDKPTFAASGADVDLAEWAR
jgi:hypothetical protein